MEQGLQSRPEPPGKFQARTLIPEILAGNEKAFNEFYDCYCDRLFRYLLVMTRGNEPLTRELLQQVFLKVIRYLKPFESDEVLWSWLTQLCKTSYIDHLRRSRRESGASFENLVANVAIESAGLEPDKELLEALQCSLRKLDDDERKLIDLFYFEDRAQREVAVELGVTVKAIESKLGRVRQRLRKLILTSIRQYVLF